MRNRLRLTTVPIQQTQLDLGDTGFSPGDQEVFTDDVFRDGNKVGRLTGFAQIIFVAENSFSAQLVTTLTLPRGSITLHGAFTEDPSVGPEPFFSPSPAAPAPTVPPTARHAPR